MPHLDQPFASNLLLQLLSREDQQLLAPHLSRVAIPRGRVLVIADKPVEHVYFPEGGVASIVASMPSTGNTEVGIFGREGVSATCLLLGADRSPHETFMQVEGTTAVCIDTAPFLAVLEQSQTMRTTLLRYVQSALVQTAQSVATIAHYRLDARLARWLLMCHDRVDGDDIALTHEFMGMMIAAERSGVTVTLHELEGEGMIRSKRGQVTILDRVKLEAVAGDCYGVPEAAYRRLIGPFGR